MMSHLEIFIESGVLVICLCPKNSFYILKILCENKSNGNAYMLTNNGIFNANIKHWPINYVGLLNPVL